MKSYLFLNKIIINLFQLLQNYVISTKLKIFLPGLIALITFSACKEESETNPANNITVNGYIQKGPFVMGSEILIQTLDNELIPTGSVFITKTNDDFGSFLVNINIEKPYIDISTTGFYFNEITGQLSNAQISLKTLAKPVQDEIINVNILTTLEFDRIEYLIKNQNLTFEEARYQAEKEILLVFNIDIDSIAGIDLIPFKDLDISKGSMNDAILIAISSILQFNNSEAQLSELVNKISDDIKDDGILDNVSFNNEIIENSQLLDFDQIRSNLLSRYSELGIQIQVADFELFIDHDGNGVIDLFQNPAPIISPSPLMIHEDPVLISITVLNDAEIYYTLDGSIPDKQSLLYTVPFYIGLDGKTTTVKAIAYSNTLEESPVSSYTYYFMFQQTFSPKFNLYAGTYNQDISLELSSETNEASIYYTTDVSTPDSNSTMYTGPISINGDRTIFQIKAIAIHKYLEQSLISSSYYKIDYNYVPDIYMDSLDLTTYKEMITGKWIGHVTTPWTGPYNVQIEFFANGNYSAHSLSGYKYPGGDETFFPAFYYGTDNDSELKTIDINDLYANGKAKGDIVIYFDPNTNTGSLEHISFSNDFNNLQFEFWHQNQYGPLTYYLTRIIE